MFLLCSCCCVLLAFLVCIVAVESILIRCICLFICSKCCNVCVCLSVAHGAPAAMWFTFAGWLPVLALLPFVRMSFIRRSYEAKALHADPLRSYVLCVCCLVYYCYVLFVFYLLLWWMFWLLLLFRLSLVVCCSKYILTLI